MSQASVLREVDVRLKSILLATDLSPASEGALYQALGMARSFHATLHVVHVVSSLGMTLAGPEAARISTSLAQRDASLIERRLILEGSLLNVRHKIVIRQGDIWQQIQDILRHEHIDLIVTGTHRRIGVAKMVLGSVAERIFRQSFCPVLTVGPNIPHRFEPPASDSRPVLFPTDFSDASLAAFPYAVSIANQLNAQLVLSHLLTNRSLAKEPLGRFAGIERVKQDAQSAAVLRLEQLAQTAGLSMEPACIAVVAKAADGILQVAHEVGARAIIMGLHRKNNVDAAAHAPWSTAYGVICGANCTVLTVRTS